MEKYACRAFHFIKFVARSLQMIITVVLLTLSAIWQCISWSNPLGALQWNLSVRPQVNLKPQMVKIANSQISLVAKSHSAPNILPPSSCSQNSKAIRSKSDGRQFEMAGKVDVGIDARVKNRMLDPFLTIYDTFTDAISLASEFAASMLGHVNF
ncbi:unnamed protein product [Gongylonema pulchrum]|uniref:RNase III domain-containing protein n=1 Tax=Gongylonema pulchrum TaxID=637853 RepID=A0A183EJ96_9BILA|nr:unnamed protein product [Gongylonema pulchrum]